MPKSRLLSIALALLVLAPAAFACGRERWPVKVLTDPDAKAVDFTHPHRSTIAALTSLPVQMGGQDSRSEAERKVYVLTATLVKVKLEADEDLHLVLSDGTRTMIAEMPSADCTRGAQHRWQMAKARRPLAAYASSHWTYLGWRVRVVGVLFFDFEHGQSGVAPNAVELHPVTGFRRLG